MNDNIVMFVAFLTAFFFGIQTLRILPGFFWILHSVSAGPVPWPGPIAYDPNPRIVSGMQALGAPPHHLFPQFLRYGLGVMCALLLAVMCILNKIFGWMVPLPGHELVANGMPLLAIVVGGGLSVRRAVFYKACIERLLSKSA
jgi:hypothetical protein